MNILRPGNVIKHEKFKDIAFSVAKVYGPFGSRAINKVKGYWINQGFNKSQVIMRDKIEIPNKELDKWKVCANPDAECVRYEEWV